jgi:biotin carboxyl carrier protein
VKRTKKPPRHRAVRRIDTHHFEAIHSRLDELQTQISQIPLNNHSSDQEIQQKDLQKTFHGFPVRAELPGQFFSTPNPESQPFVKIGDHVEKDDPIFIIMIMKLVNEILSPVSGIITEIFIENEEIIKEDDKIVMIIDADDKNLNVDFTLTGEEKKEKDKFIRSIFVARIAKKENADSFWLVKAGDIIQPDQPILTVKQLGNIIPIVYKGDCPAIVNPFPLSEGDIVEYGTEIAEVQYLEPEKNQS